MRPEYWPPAIAARFLEKRFFNTKAECSFDTTKSRQLLLIPGMGAPVSQLFDLVNALRSDESFHEYGVTATELGLSLGGFTDTLQTLIQKVEKELLSKTNVEQLVIYAHSHGGRFASELATYLQKQHPDLSLIVITGGTPIQERPLSLLNWLMSLSFRQWPTITQPQLANYFALCSTADTVVDLDHARTGSQARLVELENFSHRDFRRPAKIMPELKKIVGVK